MAPPPPASCEAVREARLGDVRRNQLNDVVADVCAGTNAIGIAKREPTLGVHAMDRNAAMQAVGRQRATALEAAQI